MKKILSIVMVSLIVLSTFSMLSPQPKAEPDELYSLPAGAKHWVPSDPILDTTKLLIDVDIAGQDQIAYVSPGETVSGTCIYQIWTHSPSEINQGFFIMSWTPSWPAPEGYYIPVWHGISGVYPGTGERTKAFSFTAPSTPGTYYLYWCRQAHYTMRQAVDTYDQPLTLPAHAKIIVTGTPPPPPDELYSLPAGAKHWVPSDPILDTTKLLIDVDIAGQGQIAHVNPGETVAGSCRYHIWAGHNPWEINQGFFIMSWTPSWPAPEGYYIPVWNGISGTYPGTGERTKAFSFTAPSTPGTYYLYWCRQAHYTMRQAVDTYDQPLTLPAHAKIIVTGTPPPEPLDPWEYCPYVYLDNGYDFPWNTSPDLPVNVLHTGTYFWGDLRVIQYWFHWNIDYMWWLQGFARSAYEYTMGWGWNDPLRQTAAAAGGADWEPIIIIVDDEGSIDYVLWRWHYNWLKFDLTVPGAGLFHPTYEETHIKLWWAIGSHTPLTKYFAIDIPILLKIASLLKNPKQFNPVIGKEGDLTKPPLYELYEQGITYPCEMQEWDEDLALNSGFNPSDLKYVNNPTIAYSELQPWDLFGDLLSIILGSPANILVTAPDGLRIGYDSMTQTIVNEIEGATYSGPGTEPQVVNIPSPLPGVYNVDVVGTSSGVYTITMLSMAADASLTGIETHVGETVEGAVYAYTVSITDEVMTTSPEPGAELEHLKEFIDELPHDSFDKPRLASQRKNALFNKIDEVILKVEAGNYTDAISKLLHDIRAKVDGDSTAQDWIVDPEAQTSLCVIIDHIISSIETLQQE